MKKFQITHKIILALILFIGYNHIICSQQLDVAWSLNIGSSESGCVKSAKTDKNGNIYATGYFEKDAKFGIMPVTSYGGTDIYLAQYNNSGNCLWVRTAGSPLNIKNTVTDEGNDLAVVDNKYIYLTGVFLGEASFDSVKVTSVGKEDIFLAKYSTSGKLLWVKQFGGTNQDIAYSLANDQEGNIYLAGSYQNTANFNNQVITASNETEMFLIKIDPDGKTIWLKTSHGDGRCIAKSIFYFDNNLYIGGIFNKKLILDNSTVSAKGQNDLFFAKLNTEGYLLFLKQVGAEQDENINSLVADSRNLYFTGSYAGSISYNNISSLSSMGDRDILIGKLSNNGEIIWFKGFGGKLSDEGTKIFINQNDELLLTGFFQKDISFAGQRITASGFSDIFIANFSKDGILNSLQEFGGKGQDYSSDILSNGNEVYITGYFWDLLNINNTSLISSHGASDGFLIKANDYRGSNKVEFKSDKVQLSDTIDFIVYPNPSRDFLKLACNNLVNSIIIKTIEGRIISHVPNINSKIYEYNILNLSAGSYIIEVNCENQYIIRKAFVKI
jgi:hypothetical protein